MQYRINKAYPDEVDTESQLCVLINVHLKMQTSKTVLINKKCSMELII